MAAAFPQRFGQLFLRMPKPIHQLTIPGRFFHRVQVSPLYILDNCDFQNLGIRKFAHQNRRIMQLRLLRRAPAAS